MSAPRNRVSAPHRTGVGQRRRRELLRRAEERDVLPVGLPGPGPRQVRRRRLHRGSVGRSARIGREDVSPTRRRQGRLNCQVSPSSSNYGHPQYQRHHELRGLGEGAESAVCRYRWYLPWEPMSVTLSSERPRSQAHSGRKTQAGESRRAGAWKGTGGFG